MNLIRPDFDAVLAPLRNAETVTEADEWPAAAYLGEIRLRYADGRRGTIYLKQALDNPRDVSSPMRVFMVIGKNRYRACTLKELRTVARPCAERGTPVAR